MKQYSFNTIYSEPPILTGYVGAAVIITFLFIITLFNLGHFDLIGIQIKNDEQLLIMIFSVFISMVVAERIAKKSYISNSWLKSNKIKIRKTNFHLIISTLYRFSTLLIIFYLMVFIINKHYYFSDDSFQITRKFFTYLLSLYFFLGIPYIFFTLKYRSSIKYDLNDYAMNLMLGFRGAMYAIYAIIVNKKSYLRRAKLILFSRRLRKVILTYIVIFFFLTLMVKFLKIEFSEFEKAVNTIYLSEHFTTLFDKYQAWYVMLYHLLFTVDLSLAVIGYTFVSRWLDNCTRSVEMTLGGWIVALMCYPPMNDGFAGQFINYRSFETPNIITSEIARMIIMALTLILITIYVWATVALSFKFSNLTNRGIVTTGPYAIVRHPAYVSKNLSWWLESTFVLSNFWATLALLAWNIIYVLRALTEERHLKKDPKYQEYCKKVKYRFIPGVI